MKLLLLFFGFISAYTSYASYETTSRETTSYTNSLGLKGAYFSAATYCPEKRVNNWSCHWCNKVPYFNLIETFWDNKTSTFCYFGRYNNSNDYVLAFEGSQDNRDLLIDLQIAQLVPYKHYPDAKVHSGFWKSYLAIADEVHKLLNIHNVKNLFVTGHSLGGALATIASLDIVEELGIKNVSMVSLGAPRVGNAGYADLYASMLNNYYRITHASDPVVHLPYMYLNYKHIPHEIFYPKRGSLVSETYPKRGLLQSETYPKRGLQTPETYPKRASFVIYDPLEYIECERGESLKCANSRANYPLNFTDHAYYMNIKVATCLG
jgi:pimeloyl-ACP methyl ester carboxylesterase